MIILNFHGLGPVKREIDAGEHACWLDTPHFEVLLDRIRDNPDVRITFDDGNVSDYEIAMPALLKRRMRAVFFVCSGRIGETSFLNEEQVRELVSNGMTIGSHGAQHKSWRGLGPAELNRELAESRMALEEICGRKVDLAACPFGSYDRRVLAALKRAGYSAVFTSDGAPCRENQWLRPRTTIRRSFTPDLLDQMIEKRPTTVRRFLDGARILVKRNRPGTLWIAPTGPRQG